MPDAHADATLTSIINHRTPADSPYFFGWTLIQSDTPSTMRLINLVLLSATSVLLLLSHSAHADRVDVGYSYLDPNCPTNEAATFKIQSPWQSAASSIRSVRPTRRLYIYAAQDCSAPGYTAEAGRCSNLPNNAYIHCVQIPK